MEAVTPGRPVVLFRINPVNCVCFHPRSESESLSRRICAIAFLLALAATGVAYTRFFMFSFFPGWDDEGYMMLTVQQMLSGQPLYADASVPYGPFYYLTRWFLHGLCGVPVDHDSFRATALFEWNASAAIFALAAWRFCKRSAFAIALVACCFVAGIIHLQAIAGGPGHPQAMLVLVLSIALLIGSSFSFRRAGLHAFALGCCCAATLFLKINVGVFFLVAILLAIFSGATSSWLFRSVRAAVLVAAVALPLLLLKPQLHDAWAQKFCTMVVISLVSCWFVANRAAPPMISRALVVGLCSGLGLVTAICVCFVMLHGCSPFQLLTSILLKALRFPGVFGWPLQQGPFHTTLAFIGAALAGFHVLPKSSRWDELLQNIALPALKLLVGSAVFIAACESSVVDRVIGESWPFSFAAGFLWLVIVPPCSHRNEIVSVFARKLVAFTASLQVLQMYPVPGGQLQIGTISMVLLAAILVGDSLSAVEAAWGERSSGLSVWPQLAVWSFCMLPAAVLLMHVRSAKRAFYSVEEVHLPGSSLTRMPEDQAGIYRCLADTVRDSAETFVCKFGFNSLYFWAGKMPASTIPISHSWQLFDPGQQEQLLVANQSVQNLVFVDHPGFAPKVRMFPFEKREIPLFTYVQSEMQPRMRVGDFKLYTRRDRDYLKLRSCAVAVDATDATESRLQIIFPDNFAGREVSRAEVADFGNEFPLCTTDAPEAGKRATLLDENGRDVFLNQSRSATIPSGRAQWTMTLPAGMSLERAASPMLRFYNGRERVGTLPVAVKFSAERL